MPSRTTMSPPSEPVISFGRSSPAATGTVAANTIWATLIPQYQIRVVVACRSYHRTRRLLTTAALMPDERARAAYRRRLAELDDLLDSADARGDPAASDRARAERSALLAELAAATGLGGRRRRLGDEDERARRAVTARIRDVLRRIRAVHPELADHLDPTVSTGTACRYAPPEPVNW